MMPGSYVSDAQGEPFPFYVKGADASDPDKIEVCYLEVRSGGMTVAKRMPSQRITVAADPHVPPSLAEVTVDRERRARESGEREREAIAQERGEDFTPSSETDQLLDVNGEATDDADATVENGETDQEREEREAREATARRSGSGGSRRKTSSSRS